jgi:hypothetical protein
MGLSTCTATVRSLFATSKRRVCTFPELLRQVLRATARQSTSPVETEVGRCTLNQVDP